MDTVNIGCRLPHGLIIEAGLQVTAKTPDGKLITSVQKTPAYKSHVIKGTNEHHRLVAVGGGQLPALLRPDPVITRGVPRDLWEEWYKTHKDGWFIKSGNLFLVKDEADLKAHALDLAKETPPLAPIDSTKPLDMNGAVTTFDPKAA